MTTARRDDDSGFGDARRGEQEPTRTRTPNDPLADTIERHPAYAAIRAARMTGRLRLYGSEFVHQSFVSIVIARSELHRGLSSDYHFDREELIEVTLSEAQWAAFVSTLNIGHGVPCTIDHVAGTRPPRIAQRAETKADTFKREFGEHFAETITLLQSVRTRLLGGKAGKETLSILDKAIQHLQSNLGFVADQFGGHVETTVERMKIEVGAWATSVLHRLGLSAASTTGPLALDEERKKNP